jgi:hypothetical protein
VKKSLARCCPSGFTDTAEVVRQANASIYGLQAGVWTSDINKAHGVARALRAGTVHVNQYDEDDITVPFGGFKQSGVGRDKSLHAFDKYTETKTTWIRIDTGIKRWCRQQLRLHPGDGADLAKPQVLGSDPHSAKR